MTMALALDESIALAMETDVRLLPLLPELLVDLWELGTSADQVVSALESIGVEQESSILDLACGKGAVAVRLAERMRARVEGVDAFEPFLETARSMAMERGVGDRCSFSRGDIRKRLGQEGHYDVVLLLSVGPLSGDHEKTVGDLRTLVRKGGYIVIEDGFLAEGVERLAGAEAYAGHTEMLRRLTASGDVLDKEIICSAEQTRAMNDKNTELIRQRARAVKASHPGFERLIDEYVARQELETEILGRDLICALWILRRI